MFVLQNFYMSETEPMENERTHVCRYHSQSHQHPGTSLQTRKHVRQSYSLSVQQAVIKPYCTFEMVFLVILLWLRYKAMPVFLQAQSSPEDFHIDVSPGTYKITAGTQDSQQQTRVVRINAGESMNLTFHL
uniref:Uncharacterized protein n=1 Tax=Oncorhynchus tshawytscha TaxID=74940 RepID=A0A8C8FB61_ONCTS